MAELKPCPFCGGEVTIYYSSMTKGYFFIHDKRDNPCILLTPSAILGKHECLQDAYNAWNRRVDNG